MSEEVVAMVQIVTKAGRPACTRALVLADDDVERACALILDGVIPSDFEAQDGGEMTNMQSREPSAVVPPRLSADDIYIGRYQVYSNADMSNVVAHQTMARDADGTHSYEHKVFRITDAAARRVHSNHGISGTVEHRSGNIVWDNGYTSIPVNNQSRGGGKGKGKGKGKGNRGQPPPPPPGGKKPAAGAPAGPAAESVAVAPPRLEGARLSVNQLKQRLAEAEAQLLPLENLVQHFTEQLQAGEPVATEALAEVVMSAEEASEAIDEISGMMNKDTVRPQYEVDTSIGLVLVDKGSPHQCIFDDRDVLQSGAQATLSLRSHRGLGVGTKYDEERQAGHWRYIEATGACAQADAVAVRWVDKQFMMLSDRNLVLDVAHWKMQAGTPVNFVGGTGHHPTKAGGGGRDWLINEDGTISAMHSKHLVLGLHHLPSRVDRSDLFYDLENDSTASGRAHALEAAAGALHAQVLERTFVAPKLIKLRADLNKLQATMQTLPVSGALSCGCALDMRTVAQKHHAVRMRGTNICGADAESLAAAQQACTSVLREAVELKAAVRGDELTLGRWVLQSANWKAVQAEVHAVWEAALVCHQGEDEFANVFGDSAYLPNIENTEDHDVLQHWTKPHAILPEYQRAASMICIEREWMADTMLLRHIRQTASAHSAEIAAIKKDPRAFDKVLVQAIQKAYDLKDENACRKQQDVLSGENIYCKVKQVYETLEGWKRPYFIHAWRLIVSHENEVGAIVSKLSEVVDHSMHCPHVQVKAFQLVLAHCSRLVVAAMSQKLPSAKLDCMPEPTLDKVTEASCMATAAETESHHLQYHDALLRFYECFEDFLDDHKEHAFSASFMEPARLYLSNADVGAHWLADNVDTHANNWHIALLNSALGVHVPLLANYWDDFPPPVVDFWAGLQSGAWEFFANPNHFGNGWRGIPGLKREAKRLIARRVETGRLPMSAGKIGNRQYCLGQGLDTGMKTAKKWANKCVDPHHKQEKLRKGVAVYLERFAHFFTRDFFVKKAFEVLHAEFKPEHTGFRKACASLFAVYRAEQLDLGDSNCDFAEYCYGGDEVFTTLDVDRVAKFFVWMGVLKPRCCADSPLVPATAHKVYQSLASGSVTNPASATKAATKVEAPTPTARAKKMQVLNAKIAVALKVRDTDKIRELMKQREALKN